MSSEAYHEPIELIPEPTKDLHRGITSLIEELEAVDWYNQRAVACSDPELRDVLIHNRNEEIEHAMMVLEWLRRNFPEVDARARIYLFAEGPITTIEQRVEAAKGASSLPAAQPKPGAVAPRTPDDTLGIGSLRRA